MTEHSKSSSHDLRKMFVIGSFCKACRSLVSRRNNQDKRHHSSGKSRSHSKRKSDDDKNKNISKGLNDNIEEEEEEEEVMNSVHRGGDETISPRGGGGGGGGGIFKHRSVDNHFTSHPSPLSSPTPLSRNTSLSRSASRRSRTPTPMSAATRLIKSLSRKNISDLNIDTAGSLTRSARKKEPGTPKKEGGLLSKSSSRKDNNGTAHHHHSEGGGGGGLLSRNYSSKKATGGQLEGSQLSRNLSRKGSSMNQPAGGLLSKSSSGRKGSTAPIMFSNSNGLVKPPPMEKQIECTLEELCFGTVKRVMITRDVVTDDGRILEEEEKLTIKVKPGWTKGTQITFEGMGSERPGSQAADIIFVIAEKKHPLFRREGDDLELAVRVPLVKALTGCNLSIPLLGGEKMSLNVDDIIRPGYEKIIPGQGMPKSKVQQGNRGNLIIKFLIEFSQQLTQEQKANVVSILQGAS